MSIWRKRTMSNYNPELKACPFCLSGNVELYLKKEIFLCVICLHCGATGPRKETAEFAAHFWNFCARPGPVPVRKKKLAPAPKPKKFERFFPKKPTPRPTFTRRRWFLKQFNPDTGALETEDGRRSFEFGFQRETIKALKDAGLLTFVDKQPFLTDKGKEHLCVVI